MKADSKPTTTEEPPLKEGLMTTSTAKYASEAFEFLRLFNRIGKSTTGLALLEVCWILVLLLLKKVIADSNGAASLPLPVPAFSSNWPLITWAMTNLTVERLYLMGAGLIIIAWIIHSRAYQLAAWPFRKLIKLPLSIALITIFFLVGIGLLPLLPLLWIGQHAQQRKALKAHRLQFTGAYMRENKDSTLEGANVAYDEWRAKHEKTHGRDALRNALAHRLSIRVATIHEALGRMLSRILAFIFSPCRIGLAFPPPLSFEEEKQASKLASQGFAVATARLRLHLRHLRGIQHLHFLALPSHLRIETPRQAQWVRRLMDLDVLLWGTYASVDTGTLWVNIERPLVQESATEQDFENRHSFIEELFPYSLTVNISAITFRQDSVEGFYFSLVAAVMQALAIRSKTRTSYFRNWDQLAHSYRSTDFVLQHLAREYITSQPASGGNDDIGSTSPSTLLAEVVGAWVGYQFNEHLAISKLKSDWESSHYAGQLYRICLDCACRTPDDPRHHYRLGALSCLMQKPEMAKQHFKKAGELVTRDALTFGISALTKAQITLAEARNAYGVRQSVHLAAFSAFGAAVAHSNDAFSISQLRRELKDPVLPIQLGGSDEAPLEVEMILTMLPAGEGPA